MIRKILVVAVLILCSAVWAENIGYNGYKVFRIEPTGEKQINDLLGLQNVDEFDFWSRINNHGKPIDVMIPPHRELDLKIFLNNREIKYAVLVDNVQSIFNQDFKNRSQQPCEKDGKISFKKYNTNTEINNYIKDLAKTWPQLVSIKEIGKTYEGRELNLLKISTDPTANKPIIFIDAGIHAREWIAPALATFIIHQIVEFEENRNLLDKVDWHILPILNPDGYAYTHNINRFWRKNRSKGKSCNGTDQNRNFNFHWGGLGSESRECLETYKGPKAASELETQALSKYLLNTKNVKLYLTLHTHGNYILYPWGYTTELPENAKELQSLGELVAKSMNKVLGKSYTVGSSATALYPTAGGSDDWAKGVAGIKLSYTIELSGGGVTGFNPPPSQIIPFVTEGWEGIKVYHNYIEHKFGHNNTYIV